MVDLGPAARRLSDLLNRIDGESLSAPTPSGQSTVGDILDHINGLAQAFAAAATKGLGPMTSTPSAPDGSRLSAQWRTDIFGPPVDVPGDAPLADRVVALSGRDPGWTSPASPA